MERKPHIPVMLSEVLEYLRPADKEIYCDGTFGAGGYTSAILDAANCRVIALDRDPTAIANGQALADRYAPRLTLIQSQFSRMREAITAQNLGKLDGIVLDIGVSSMQIDQAARGFSFQKDGPLDMRMGEGETAAELITRLSETDLANVIYTYGEERQSRKIARAIKLALQDAPITTTLQLADLIERTTPRKRGDKIHPATRTFQALRIAVNDELGELETILQHSIDLLKPGGRLVVVTFHSLEDRIVKNFLRDHTDQVKSKNKYAKETTVMTQPFTLLTRKAVAASDLEAQQNPRARSAKLRAAMRTEVMI